MEVTAFRNSVKTSVRLNKLAIRHVNLTRLRIELEEDMLEDLFDTGAESSFIYVDIVNKYFCYKSLQRVSIIVLPPGSTTKRDLGCSSSK